jgi:hypothetical protein
MRKKVIQLIILILTLCDGLPLLAQNALISSGGEGTGTGGSFSFSLGQIADQTFFTGYSTIEEGVQHAFETSLVPSNYFLSNSTLSSGSTTCYDALQNITVAGDGNPVTIQNSAIADFIAGASIDFLPGFHALQGSRVHGYITLTGSFCDVSFAPSIVEVKPEEKSIDTLAMSNNTHPFITGKDENEDIVLFPNPNNGQFKIKPFNLEGIPVIKVYNLTGAVFYKSVLNRESINEVNIPALSKGVYFVRISNQKKEFVKKIVVD